MTEATDGPKTSPIPDIIGGAWTDWEEHRQLCCISEKEFVKHLLNVHRKSCDTYLEATDSKPLAKVNGLCDVHDVKKEDGGKVNTKDAGTQCDSPPPASQHTSHLAITNVESLRNSHNHNDLLSENAGYPRDNQRSSPDAGTMEHDGNSTESSTDAPIIVSTLNLNVKNERHEDYGYEDRSSEDSSQRLGIPVRGRPRRTDRDVDRQYPADVDSQRNFMSNIHLARTGTTPIQPAVTPPRMPLHANPQMASMAYSGLINQARAMHNIRQADRAAEANRINAQAVARTKAAVSARANAAAAAVKSNLLAAVQHHTPPQSAAQKARGNYCKYSVQFKRTVCQYAKQHDIQTAQKHFSRIVPQLRSKTIYYWLSVMKLDPPNVTPNTPVIPVYTRYSARFKHQVCEYSINHSLREAVKEFGGKAPKLCDTLINYWMKKHDRERVFSPEDKEENEIPSAKPEGQTAGARFNYTDQLKYEVATYAQIFTIEKAITVFGAGGVDLDEKTVTKWVEERKDEPLPEPEEDVVDDSMVDDNGIDPESIKGIYQGPHVTYSGKRRPNYSHELMLDVSAYALNHSIHAAINAFKTVTPMLSRASVRRFMQKNRPAIENHTRTINYSPSPVKYLQPEEFALRSQFISEEEQAKSTANNWQGKPPTSQQWYQDDGNEQEEETPIVVPLNGDEEDDHEIGIEAIGIEPIGIEPIDDEVTTVQAGDEADDYTAFTVGSKSTEHKAKRTSHVAKKSTGGVINKDLIYPSKFRGQVCSYAFENGVVKALNKYKVISPSLTMDLIKNWMHKLDDNHEEDDEPVVKRLRRGEAGSGEVSPTNATGPKFAIDGEDYSHLPQHVCEHAKLNGIESAVTLYKPVIPDLSEALIRKWMKAVDAKQKAEERRLEEQELEQHLDEELGTEDDAEENDDESSETDALTRFKNMVCAYARNDGVEQAAIRFSRSDTNAILAPETISSWLREGYGSNTSLSDKMINPVHAQDNPEAAPASPGAPDRRRCSRYSNEFKKTVCNYARETSANVAWRFFKQVEPDLSIQIVSYWLKKGNF